MEEDHIGLKSLEFTRKHNDCSMPSEYIFGVPFLKAESPLQA
jgi:hypothetical protein